MERDDICTCEMHPTYCRSLEKSKLVYSWLEDLSIILPLYKGREGNSRQTLVPEPPYVFVDKSWHSMLLFFDKFWLKEPCFFPGCPRVSGFLQASLEMPHEASYFFFVKAHDS